MNTAQSLTDEQIEETWNDLGLRTKFAPYMMKFARALLAAQQSTLSNVPSDELRLELALRKGPTYQCQSPACRSYEDGPGKWDTCPSCGRKGYLCGSFEEERKSPQWKDWERRTIAKYRPAGQASQPLPSDTDKLAQAIHDAAVRKGIIHAGTPLSGPQLLHLCDLLGAQQAQEDSRIAYVVFDGDDPIYSASYESACHEHINDAINEHDIEGAGKWQVRKMVATPSRPVSAQSAEKDAITDIAAERERQKAVEGWTPERDDEHTDNSLVEAAIAYAMAAKAEPADRAVIDSFGFDGLTFKIKSAWPCSWDVRYFKPKSRRRDLVRAAALLAAEIDRIDRAALAQQAAKEQQS